MNKVIHFFDLDNTLWTINSNAWVIIKDNPSKPIIILNKIELDDISNGVFKKEDNLIEYNGNQYWISDLMVDRIKKRFKNIELKDLGISFIEFTNPDYYDKIHIFLENIRHLIGNKNVEIGIISARYSVENDKNILVALKDELNKFGLSISKFYYISDSFKKRNNDKINIDKMKVIMEHVTGFHIKGDHFLPLKQDFYNEIHFYDDEIQNINTVNNIQIYLEEYIKNSEDEIFHKVISKIDKFNPVVYTHLISNNNLNRFKTTKIDIKKPIKFSIKVDENFSLRFKDFINRKRK